MSDFIDLTEDSPDPGPKRPRHNKNHDDEQEARARIMAFAKRASQQQQLEQPEQREQQEQQQQILSSDTQQPSPPPHRPSSEHTLGNLPPAAQPGGEEQQARQRIMDFALKSNAARGLSLAALREGAATAGTAAAAVADAVPSQPAGPAPAAPGNGVPNSLLAQLHMERMARRQALQQQAQQEPGQGQGHQGPTGPLQAPAAGLEDRSGGTGAGQHAGASQQRQEQGNGAAAAAPPSGPGRLSVLSYNLWFREDVEVEARMQAVGGIIAEQGNPDFLCFQEVTPLIYSLLQQSPWWQRYSGTGLPSGSPYFTLLMWRKDTVAVGRTGNLPFSNSVMGRDLKCASAAVGRRGVLVATSHLESPTGWGQLHSRERVAQCKQAVQLLEQVAKGEDIVFVGDMNWNPDDGQPPLPGGWCDAWLHLHTTDPGLTYDPKANPMLNPKFRIRRRLDRAFCRLGQGWRMVGMELVGQEPLPGLRFEGRPVLPSDHFGMMLRLEAI